MATLEGAAGGNPTPAQGYHLLQRETNCRLELSQNKDPTLQSFATFVQHVESEEKKYIETRGLFSKESI